MSVSLPIDPFPEVLAAFQRGEAIILVDDAGRENEGDIVVAAERITPELVAFMMRDARGLICVSLTAERAAELMLPLQTTHNGLPYGTAFTVSVDLAAVGAAGVSAASRAATIKALVDPAFTAADFVSPGHVFPLIANKEGVIGRQGHTEGSIDLTRLAGLAPAGVICEILNPDGTMARGEQLLEFAQRFKLKVSSVEEIVTYRVRSEVLLRVVAQAQTQTMFGSCTTIVFQDDVARKEHMALVFGDLSACGEDGPLVRIHSECLTGDVFGSRRCDCGEQLHESMRMIVEHGAGIIVYLRQEGRGIGLANKLKAYALQDEGHDTVEANIKLGFPADIRDFAVAAKMLDHLAVEKVQILTNNPEKIATLERFGIKISARRPIIAAPDEYSREYLATKRAKMGHWL
jgi:3,4-dihydroxy 2-butanone 4-phosphate synthase/GTP cyclohydrolase II